MNETMTINEVAELFGVHRAIVYRWVKSGKIPYVRILKNPTSKRETIRFERAVMAEQFQSSRHLQKIEMRRHYDIPQYVLKYIVEMADQHRDTPADILQFVRKYSGV